MTFYDVMSSEEFQKVRLRWHGLSDHHAHAGLKGFLGLVGVAKGALDRGSLQRSVAGRGSNSNGFRFVVIGRG